MNRVSVQHAVPLDPESFDNPLKEATARCTD